MSTELAKINEQSVVTPMQLLDKAMAKGVDIDQLQKLMDLQERWEANEAKKAFTAALSGFKKEVIEIVKNKTVTYENQDGSKTSYSHATLDHIVEVVTPKLSAHGLSHRWSTAQGDGGRITVTCELTHVMGHSESVSLSASPDDSGKKNNIQRIASTVTYLERYTFLMITGLAAKGLDDDGISSGEKTDPKALLEAEMRGIEYMKNCLKHMAVIDEVKDRLADDDLEAAADTLATLTNKELQSISRAATKGGIFTLEETKKMGKHNEAWQEVWQRAMQNHPEVDRSL